MNQTRLPQIHRFNILISWNFIQIICESVATNNQAILGSNDPTVIKILFAYAQDDAGTRMTPFHSLKDDAAR